MTIIGAVAQAECEFRSKNTRWGLENRAKNGSCGLYKRRCFGYYTDEYGNLQINVKEAEVVRSIFEMYLSGNSLVGIIKNLEANDIKTPTGKNKWCKNTLDKLLSNEKYTGRVEIFKSFSIKQINPIAPFKTLKNNGEFAKYVMLESHPEIIPQDFFDAVQKEKTQRTNIENVGDTSKRKNTRYSSKRDSIKSNQPKIFEM